MPIGIDLPLIWTGIIAFAVFMYVLMDGFDLGVGILFPFAPSEEDRDVMMNTVAPVWDGNETWLILGGAGLFGAFPLAYAVVLPAMYLPILLMLIALIFRGVAFEFRFKAGPRDRRLWTAAFALGSIFATFAQGLVLGGFIQGIRVEGRDFAGGILDWLSPFSVMTGLGLIAGYALVGAAWLVWKTEGLLQDWAFRLARLLLFAVLFFIVLVSLWTPLFNDAVAERWFSWPNILYFSPVPVVTLLLAVWMLRSLNRFDEVLPFFQSVGLFLLSYLGLAISLWPNLIPPSITLWEAAAPPETQIFLLVGVGTLLPVIVGYTAFTYYVFRGKVRRAAGYH
ncbi:MAG TPA: cytochrome d ubiquinol oxidase subunit II [Azospirillaceae bacterium]|nr:cytochrome d ubiquinol oxidase subunit II [Azospirillaceae bacterium]